MTTIVRAQVAHTPGNPFVQERALQAFSDGAVAFDAGRTLSTDRYGDVRAGYPDAELLDARDAFLLPGFVDCHFHFPQIRVIGAMGLEGRESSDDALRALFTLAGEESVSEVRVGGRVFSEAVS